MSETQTWLLEFKNSLAEAWFSVIANGPALILGFFILVAGWFVARILRAAVRRLTNTANALLDRVFRRGVLSGARLSQGVMAALGELVFWLTVLFAATVALRIAGLTALADWLIEASAYIPNLLVGAAIIALGYVINKLVGDQVASQAGAQKSRHSALVSKIAQLSIFIITLVIGLDQIGVDVTFLVALFAVAAGAALSGLSFAFAIGSRDHVRNLLGVRVAQREIAPGQSVRIGSVTGNVLEITRTHIALDTPEGKAIVPGHFIDHQGILLLEPEPEIEITKGRADG